MKHTPGPWKWRIDRDKDWDGISSLGELPDMYALYGTCPPWGGILGGAWHNDSTAGIGLNGDNPEADARLIAASPELLAALKLAREALFDTQYFEPSDLDAIDAAIRKAEEGQ